MLYFNLDQPYEDVVLDLKRYYAEKANQGVIEHLIRTDAIRLGLWPAHIPAPKESQVVALEKASA